MKTYPPVAYIAAFKRLLSAKQSTKILLDSVDIVTEAAGAIATQNSEAVQESVK